ncbi:hypothetical protein CRM22_005841 [Opisthorchis felineus]|uniref:Sulfhydryl oxidase n=1 Tax=Opisthorchis felineus TaxID=147828 RepID=A0A4S2LV57_OPIFE|nr:hypothetical protein CRM22_005841 [Opisthorchis felineus]
MVVFHSVLLWALFPLTFGGDYSNLDNVVYLTAENFTEHTNDGRWLMLFYFHSCGGCTRYQPFFSNFSTYLKDWNPLLKVGAVDCELPENGGICSSFTVVGVPDLRYLPSGRFSNDTGVVIDDEKESFIGLRNKLLDFLKNEISLDSSSVQYKKLLTILSNIDQPVPLDREHDGTTTTLELAVTNPVDQRPAVRIPVYSDDIFRSLTILFFNDISLIGVIHKNELAGLREFLFVLSKLLPASEDYRAKLSEMYQWVNAMYDHPRGAKQLTGRLWLDKLKEIQFPEFRGEFVACKGSKPGYRGYPCGLWILFHVLTVEHYNIGDRHPELTGDAVAHAMNRFIPRFFSCTICAFHFAGNSANIARSGEPRFPEHRPKPSEFSWDESILNQLPAAPTTALEEVLWLNAVHNRVNKRLSGDVTEDPMAKKVQYPPRDLCPACWSRDPENDEKYILGKTEETKAVLFDFLVNHYRPTSWVTAALPLSFLKLKGLVEWEDSTSRDFITVVAISVVLTIVAVVAILLLSRFIWRCRTRKGGVSGYSHPGSTGLLSARP